MRDLFSESENRYPSALSSIMHALKDREETAFFNCSPIARRETAPAPRLHIASLGPKGPVMWRGQERQTAQHAYLHKHYDQELQEDMYQQVEN